MKEKTKVKKMYILNGGSFLYDTGMMQYSGSHGDAGQRTHPRSAGFDHRAPGKRVLSVGI